MIGRSLNLICSTIRKEVFPSLVSHYPMFFKQILARQQSATISVSCAKQLCQTSAPAEASEQLLAGLTAAER